MKKLEAICACYVGHRSGDQCPCDCHPFGVKWAENRQLRLEALNTVDARFSDPKAGG